jgi:hypothetical protein
MTTHASPVRQGGEDVTVSASPTVPTDIHGQALGRGGFPRNYVGAALVSDPTGATVKSGPRRGQTKFLPYKAASSVVVQTSTVALDTWKQNRLLTALGRDPGFATEAAALLAAVEPGSEQERTLLTALRDRAHDIAGTLLASQRGTFAHWLTECEDLGESPLDGLEKGEALGLSAQTAARIMAGWRTFMAGYSLTSLEVEAKIVNDSLRAAGTTDRMARLDADLTVTTGSGPVVIAAGTVLVVDLKTGKLRLRSDGRPLYWEKYVGQLAAYAGGVPYDPVTGTRGQWPWPVDQRFALIVHADLLAIADGSDTDGFSLFVVDLEDGRRLAEASNLLRTMEKAAGSAILPPAGPRPHTLHDC